MAATVNRNWAELLGRVADGLMVWTHSGRVRPGDVFVALPGSKVDGSAFIPQALENGAAYVVARDATNFPEGASAKLILRDDPRQALGELARAYFKTHLHPFKLIGVTGTNGKTTVSYLVEYLMAANSRRVGVLGTINYRWPGVVLESQLTTPDCWKTHELLANMARSDVEAVVMEVSSHALDQKRVAGLSFDVAVMTNLTQDHLDYHKDMDDYFAAKSKLFTEYLAPDGRAVLNYDDAACRGLLRGMEGAVGFGLSAAPHGNFETLKGELISSTASGLRLAMENSGRTWQINSPLVGRHNAENLLAAQAAALKLGLGPRSMKVLDNFYGVPGRLERVPNDRGLDVFVDYAHTPDALRNVLSSIKALDVNKLLVVFGCGGDRDRTKRPLMGQAVCEYADVAVLTSDNPRTEEPGRIMDDTFEGMGDCPRVVREEDRYEAIRLALREMLPGDALVVAGKGHELYQQIGDLKFPFSDAKVVREILECA
ncbi:UDP-N-acetylmuramoyl-L-alanyl-D-glutamate--2,6-diaminopimelate ligase [Desulfohalovibrio reitneri]|uniref:UDP-N-acetylmuramoyl-L-alanyl-D-glutamate--2, 6-diaminopimelate ligase n=1 Tax=Desulfohalovibrio reitneri TaxID=1307759 RepID=UPI0004A6FBB2|nr:UDP-N-acetylmuramoyl-L-alanyl-D-glutamate--2,6-diaminopimelate ligase [Desulfohalovibrio reitneri]